MARRKWKQVSVDSEKLDRTRAAMEAAVERADLPPGYPGKDLPAAGVIAASLDFMARYCEGRINSLLSERFLDDMNKQIGRMIADNVCKIAPGAAMPGEDANGWPTIYIRGKDDTQFQLSMEANYIKGPTQILEPTEAEA